VKPSNLAAASGNLPRVNTIDDFNTLRVGAHFLDLDGVEKVKKQQ
jgi:hypothetical protein